MKLTKEKEAQLTKLMKEYSASDIDELMDILPDLVLEEEDELPQLPQQEAALSEYFLNYKEPAILGDDSCYVYGR